MLSPEQLIIMAEPGTPSDHPIRREEPDIPYNPTRLPDRQPLTTPPEQPVTQPNRPLVPVR